MAQPSKLMAVLGAVDRLGPSSTEAVVHVAAGNLRTAVPSALERLEQAGLVARTPAGWAVTPEGRARLSRSRP